MGSQALNQTLIQRHTMRLFFVLIVGSINGLPYPKFGWEEVLTKLKADMSQLAGPLNDIASGVNNFFDEWPLVELKSQSTQETTTRKWFETTEVPAHPSETVKPLEKQVKILVPSIQQSENKQVFIEAKNRVPLSPPKENRYFKSPRTTKPTLFAHATVTESDITPTYLNTEYSDDSVTELMTTLEAKPVRKVTTTTKRPTTTKTTTKTTTTTTTTTSINWTRNGKNT